MLDLNSLVPDIHIVSGCLIFDGPLRVGSLKDLMFGLFNSGLDAVPTAIHNTAAVFNHTISECRCFVWLDVQVLWPHEGVPLSREPLEVWGKCKYFQTFC